MTRALLLALVGLAGCRAPAPPSLLLTVVNGPDSPEPDSLQLWVFDRNGPAHDAAAFPVQVGTGGALGTVVVYPGGSGALALRVQAHGLQQNRVVSHGVLSVALVAGSQSRAEVVLDTDRIGADRDGDGVFDAIDNCAGGPNPEQLDDDGDGVGNGCGGPVDGGQPDAGHDAPGARAIGAACVVGDGCESGFCIDGVCCESSCETACHACNQPERMGRCTPIEAGQPDPHSRCQMQPVESCALDGTCDGMGACRKHPAGTICRPASCAGPERSLPASCDGAGTCGIASRQSCAPYLCAAGACKTTCSGPGDCAGGHLCLDSSCGKAPLGAACSSGDTCNSGHCLDGVCCDVPSCAGPCRACNVTGAAGSCVSFPPNSDPRAAGCPSEAASTCGRTGRCDGSGGCQLHSTGTTCGTRTCNGDVETVASTCNGAGQCLEGMARSCGNYSCKDDVCAIRCGQDPDCTSGAFCEAELCVPKRASGASCTEARACASSACVDGHCCQMASCPAGQGCTGPGGSCEDKLALGAACSAGTACASGFCSDGVCCNVACTDPCRRCDAAPAGTCQIITRDRDTCSPPQRCSSAGVCQ